MSCSGEIYSHSDLENNLIQIIPSIKQKLQKAKYGVFNHSAVELCHWTKKSFSDEGTCYKHKFYGISTHRCMEMTPTALNCENRCIYCWRPTEFYDTLEMPPHLVDEHYCEYKSCRNTTGFEIALVYKSVSLKQLYINN